MDTAVAVAGMAVAVVDTAVAVGVAEALTSAVGAEVVAARCVRAVFRAGHLVVFPAGIMLAAAGADSVFRRVEWVGLDPFRRCSIRRRR